MISKQLEQKLAAYEQIYFCFDKPVPFSGGLMIYPITVDQYYDFYNSLGCLTMDKTVKTQVDPETGKEVKVADPEGMTMSYLKYLIKHMQDKDEGPRLTAQLMKILEICFHIPQGVYCEKCDKVVTYDELVKGLDEEVETRYNETIETLKEKVPKTIKEDGTEAVAEIPPQVLDMVRQKIRSECFQSRLKCPDCGEIMRDVFSIKNEGSQQLLVIKNVEISPGEFDELKSIIPRQNITDYQGDKYINPDLKEELEIKQRLKGGESVSPSLEKQIVCVAVGTGMTLEYIRTLPIRKLSLILRSIDSKNTYYAQLQGQMSGMVEFKTPPKHWIYSDDSYDLTHELTDAGDFEKKFKNVV